MNARVPRSLIWTSIAAALAMVILLWRTNHAAPPACEMVRFEGSRFTVCRYDPVRHELRLVSTGADGAALRSFRNLDGVLGDQRPRLAFAMNAGMYDDAGAPIGLHVEAGVTRRPLNIRAGPGNFHLKPNGVFWLDGEGHVHVTETAAFAAGDVRPVWASQSGPMLVIDGALHPAIAPNGTSLNVRNGVGACGEDGGAAFVISESAVSFGRLARLFKDKLGCRDALYFDGAVSSLWAPRQGRMDAGHALGPMVAIFGRPPPS